MSLPRTITSTPFLSVTRRETCVLVDDDTPTPVDLEPKPSANDSVAQTLELINRVKASQADDTRKDPLRKSLFKGKTLATLMNERQKISLTRERRLSRTLGIIISIFLLCWFPFFFVYILSAFIDVAHHLPEPIPTFILWLGYLNSACNPLIYTVFNVEFRTAFQRLLCPSLHRNRANKRN